MAFCHISDEHEKCDLYIYEGQDGWAIKVRNTRYIGEQPYSESAFDLAKGVIDGKEFERRKVVNTLWRKNAEYEDVPGPYAGCYLHGISTEDFGPTISAILATGVQAPSWVLPDAYEEAVGLEKEYGLDPDEVFDIPEHFHISDADVGMSISLDHTYCIYIIDRHKRNKARQCRNRPAKYRQDGYCHELLHNAYSM